MDRRHEVLTRYPKAVAHLWRQSSEEKLGLVFGAGASIGLGVPSWPDLLGRIAAHPDVNGIGLVGNGLDDPLPTAAQVLFQHYRSAIVGGVESEVEIKPLVEKIIQARWKKIVHECLYRDAPMDLQGLADRDTTYRHFLSIVENAPLTVNYNFDDSIERLLHHRRVTRGAEDANLSTRSFDTIVDSRLVFRKSTGNILHVNGYLPINALEGVEGPLVLNEISFADQLIDSIGGSFATLLHYFTKHTFLFVGISLQDETLRHLLRQNAVLNPGHYHYRLHWVPDSRNISSDTRALTDGHFETYNVVTLFVDSKDIAAVGQLINMTSADLLDTARNCGVNLFFTYYLAGVPGAGKTTTFRHLASLTAHDEWVEERLELMSKPWVHLTHTERDEVDNWILRQVRLKNQNLRHQLRSIGIGINIIDRCPPDAIAFGPPKDWHSKANEILSSLANNKEGATIVPGCVLLLRGDPRELLYRAKARDRQQTATEQFVKWLQDATMLIYAGPNRRVRGVKVVETRGLTVREVVKQVSRIIFLEDYQACDLNGRLKLFATQRAKIPTTGPRSS